MGRAEAPSGRRSGRRREPPARAPLRRGGRARARNGRAALNGEGSFSLNRGWACRPLRRGSCRRCSASSRERSCASAALDRSDHAEMPPSVMMKGFANRADTSTMPRRKRQIKFARLPLMRRRKRIERRQMTTLRKDAGRASERIKRSPQAARNRMRRSIQSKLKHSAVKGDTAPAPYRAS